MWGRIKRALSVITDVLSFGRAKGWWSRDKSPFSVVPSITKDTLKQYHEQGFASSDKPGYNGPNQRETK